MEKQKIKFKLEGWNIQGFSKPGRFDYETDTEREFATREREGYLLSISEKSFQIDDKQWIKSPCAVVEDSDGQIYEILVRNIQMIN